MLLLLLLLHSYPPAIFLLHHSTIAGVRIAFPMLCQWSLASNGRALGAIGARRRRSSALSVATRQNRSAKVQAPVIHSRCCSGRG
jgi:hypothetical protein